MKDRIKFDFSMQRVSEVMADNCFDIAWSASSQLSEGIYLHDNLVEDSEEMFDSYRAHVKLPLDFENKLMFREFFSIGKNSNVWMEASKSHECNVPCEEVGSGSITLKKIENGQIVVLIIQRISIGKVQQIMEVITVIDENLQLVREDIVERVVSDEAGVEQKSLRIINCGHGSFKLANETIKSDQIISSSETSINLSEQELLTFISFGTSVVLMRHLILSKFIGCIRTLTIDINGEFHTVNDRYCTPKFVISTEQLMVQHVERSSISSSGRTLKSTSLFDSSTGHLLQDLTENSPHIIRCHSSDLKNFNEDENDLNLLLLDFVASQKSQQIGDSSKVKNLLRQFTQCLIKSRPSSLMDFTLEFLQKVERDAIERSFRAVASRHQQNSSEKFSF